jgi:hypothetical protein
MASENRLCGSERIRGELLKLGGKMVLQLLPAVKE